MNNIRHYFFDKKVSHLTIQQIIDITESKISDSRYLDDIVVDIATIDNAVSQNITFLHSPQYLDKIANSSASYCLVSENYHHKLPKNIIPIINSNPYFAYSQLVKEFYQEKLIANDPRNFNNNIHNSAIIGENSLISSHSYIGSNVVIGKNCKIMPGAVIMDYCHIGDNVKIGSNATISFAKIGNNCDIFNGVQIGQEGFGFVNHKGFNHQILQIGLVIIGNDVTIGANSCIDRGAIDNTIIEDNVKIDNLVQIAHNIKIGYGSLIAGCTAIAGSAEIGKFVQIGGNSSIAGHIKINDFAKIAGMSGVIRDVAVKSTIGGAPAIDIRDFHRLNVRLFEIAKSRNYKNSDIDNCKFTKFCNIVKLFYKIISKFTKKILQFIKK